MASTVVEPAAPIGRDDRKSAALAARRLEVPKDERVVGRYAAVRDVLRSPKMRQAGTIADRVDLSDPGEVSFFFLDGEPHRKRRGAVAAMFAQKAIAARHHAVMVRRMDIIVEQLQRDGSAVLDQLSWQMAVDVAATIIGLTESESNDALARRVLAVLDSSMAQKTGLARLINFARVLVTVNRFWKKDVVPAARSRRAQPRDDVMSFMVKEGYSKKGMLMECLSYGGAGMMTTREFIVMASWHLFGNDGLRARFLDADEAFQLTILEEILRLEPVASLLHRRAAEDMADGVAAGEKVCLAIREANTDEAVVGACPFELDPDRAKRMKVVGPYMSFGDGPHRCPGSQVALQETRVFLDRMFRLPGIRMTREPEILWNPAIQGYELRGAIVSVDPA